MWHAWERRQIRTELWWETLNDEDRLEYLKKLILKQEERKLWTEFNCLRTWTSQKGLANTATDFRTPYKAGISLLSAQGLCSMW
jgi:hypothetical protein